MTQHRNSYSIITIFLILLLGFTNPADKLDALLGLLLLVYVGSEVLGLLKLTRRFHPLILFTPIVVIFLLSSYHNAQTIQRYLSKEPITETYRSDLDDFLKTFYLMEKGVDYYSAFSQAVAQNAFKGYVAPNIWAWRLPTIFYVWKILPGTNGSVIFFSFILVAISILYTSYLVLFQLVSATRRHFALLAPYLLYPYLHFAVRDPILLHTEWWALLPMIVGVYFLLKNQLKKAVIFFCIAISIRELFIIPIFAFGLWYIVQRKKQIFLFIFPCLTFITILFIHSQFIRIHAISLTQGFLTPRLHRITPDIIQSSLAFGSGEYLFYFFRPFIIFSLLSTAALLVRRTPRSFILLSFFLFPISFLFIGSSVYNDYWGVLYIPFVLLSASLIVDIFI